jgi:hypothetical protein
MSLDELVDHLVDEIGKAHEASDHARETLQYVLGVIDTVNNEEDYNELVMEAHEKVKQALALGLTPMRTTAIITEQNVYLPVSMKDSMIYIAGIVNEMVDLTENAVNIEDKNEIKEELQAAFEIAKLLEEKWGTIETDNILNGNSEYSNGNVEHPQRTNVEGGRRKRLHKRTLRKRHNMRKQTHRKRK